jgi:hypothetical protein
MFMWVLTKSMLHLNLRNVEELIVPTSYQALLDDAILCFVFLLLARRFGVEVLSQRWFTASQYRVGQPWITRAVRGPESLCIVGESFGVGNFLLEETGCTMEHWIEKAS